jgi:hypothetical protein
MKTLKIIIFLIFGIILNSCSSSQSKMDKVSTMINYAEQNKEDMTEKDWSALEKKMGELEIDLLQNREKYTDEQVKEIGKLLGRYFAITVKKGINDFQDSMNDLGDQVEGFVKGFKSDILK